MTPEQSRRRCNSLKQTGERCNAWAMRSSRCCYFHNTESSKKRMQSQSKGGRASPRKALPPNTNNATLNTASDIVSLLSTTINQVRRGELDSKIGTSVGYLSSIILRAREQGVLESRMEEIEQELERSREHS